MNPENWLSEISQTAKAKYHVILFDITQGYRAGRLTTRKVEERLPGNRGGGRANSELFNGCGFCLG